MKTITITEKDIKAGKRNDPCHCPTAIAGARCLGVLVHVGSEEIYLNPVYSPDGFSGSLRGYSDWHYLPDDVVERIRLYDRTGEMEPFSFRIDD